MSLAYIKETYIRIGSSKYNIKDYPKREIELFKILDGRAKTIQKVPAKYQELTFHKLFGYYGSKGIVLNEKTNIDLLIRHIIQVRKIGSTIMIM